MPSGLTYVERACQDNVPTGAVYLACRNRGVPVSRARDLAEEAANEARQRVLKREFDEYGEYCRYVTRTGCNYAIDQLRRANRMQQLQKDDDFPIPTDPGGEVTADRLARLPQAMECLSPEQRALIRMKHEEGLTYDEIAARLLPQRTGSDNAHRLQIRRRLLVARRWLRSYLEGK